MSQLRLNEFNPARPLSVNRFKIKPERAVTRFAVDGKANQDTDQSQGIDNFRDAILQAVTPIEVLKPNSSYNI